MNMSTADKGDGLQVRYRMHGMNMITVDRDKEHHIWYGECGMNMSTVDTGDVHPVQYVRSDKDKWCEYRFDGACSR